MFKLNIVGRIYLLVGLAIVSLAVMGWMSVQQLNATRDQLRASELQAITESAVSVVDGYYARA